jgi:hypothetical protein
MKRIIITMVMVFLVLTTFSFGKKLATLSDLA